MPNPRSDIAEDTERDGSHSTGSDFVQVSEPGERDVSERSDSTTIVQEAAAPSSDSKTASPRAAEPASPVATACESSEDAVDSPRPADSQMDAPVEEASAHASEPRQSVPPFPAAPESPTLDRAGAGAKPAPSQAADAPAPAEAPEAPLNPRAQAEIEQFEQAAAQVKEMALSFKDKLSAAFSPGDEPPHVRDASSNPEQGGPSAWSFGSWWQPAAETDPEQAAEAPEPTQVSPTRTLDHYKPPPCSGIPRAREHGANLSQLPRHAQRCTVLLRQASHYRRPTTSLYVTWPADHALMHCCTAGMHQKPSSAALLVQSQRHAARAAPRRHTPGQRGQSSTGCVVM